MEENIMNGQQEIDDGMLAIYDDDDVDTQMDKYLTFSLKDKSYGIKIKYVNEIIEMQKITEIPDLPPFVKGVINLRGKIIPVMDMRMRFNIEQEEYNDRTCIIITDMNSFTVGLIVDIVTEVLKVPTENITNPPKFKDSENRFVSGIARVNEDVKIMLDIEKILYDEEIDAISSVIKDK